MAPAPDTAPDTAPAGATFRAIYRPPWRIDVRIDAGLDLPIEAGRLATAIGRALDAAGAPRPAAVGLILTDDRAIATLNRRHLGHAGATDVLSFPLLEPAAFPAHEGEPARRRAAHAAAARRSFVPPPTGRLLVGEIVVSVERAVAQAAAGRGGQTGDVHWRAADELRLLVTHGALHLCGWDHAERVEEAAMRTLERRLLAPLFSSGGAARSSAPRRVPAPPTGAGPRARRARGAGSRR